MAGTFAEAFRDAGKPAPPELVERLAESLEYIHSRYPHHERTVCEIQAHLTLGPPTLVDILVAAWMLNGGVVLKQRLAPAEDDPDMDALLAEISRVTTDMKEESPSDI